MSEAQWIAFNGSVVAVEFDDNHMGGGLYGLLPENIEIDDYHDGKFLATGDRLILKAARVSTKGANNTGMTSHDRDKKLLRSLWKRGHTSVFEQVTYQFSVTMPLYVIEQWKRHRTWHMNQESLRYQDKTKQEFWFELGEWRLQNLEGNKQGGNTPLSPIEQAIWGSKMVSYQDLGYKLYCEAIEAGIAKENARRFLPITLMTTCMFTVDLKNLSDFIFKRCDPDAQREIRVLAYLLKNELVSRINPWVHELLNEAFTERGWPLEYK